MRKFYILVVLIVPFFAFSQVQWADKVLDYSTEAKAVDYPGAFGHDQVLGSPSMVPGESSSISSWFPSYPNQKSEYIKVAFLEKQKVNQIAILESENLGALQEVWVYETTEADDKGQRVFVANSKVKHNEGVWNIYLKKTKEVAAIKVVLNCSKVNGYNGVDAIGISESTEPIQIEVNEIEYQAGITKKELPANVNSSYQDYYPMISPDGETLYFTWKREDDTLNNYASQHVKRTNVLGDNLYTDAVFEKEFPLDFSEVNIFMGITPDNQTVLLNCMKRDDVFEDGYVYISNKQKEGWSQPEKQFIRGYSNVNEYGVYRLSHDQQKMLVTTEMKSGYGDLDLYICFKQEDGTWGNLTNLGPKINNIFSISSPTLAADNKTLYFATAGRPGYGAQDIYMSRRLDDTWTNWSEPVNLGSQINDENWNWLVSLPASGDVFYFAEYTVNKSSQLMKANLPEEVQPEAVVMVKGRVLNKKTLEPMWADVKYFDKSTGELVGVAHSDPKTGKYAIVLPQGKEYVYYAMKHGFVEEKEELSVLAIDSYQEVSQDLFLIPVEVGETFVMNNVIFERGKAVLLRESYKELEGLLELMLEYDTLRIKIEGHTENTGKAEAELNLKLSEQRCETIRQYLIENGVSEDRIETEGFGGTRPLNNSRIEAVRRKNRRVEVRILEE